MSEPISLILAMVERHLGLERSRRWRGDPDCPPPEVLEWLADFDPLYETLPPAPQATDPWTDLRARMELQRSRKAVRRWRLATGAAAAAAAVMGIVLWTMPPKVPTPVIVEAKPVPVIRPQPPGLFAAMRQVDGKDVSLFVLVAAAQGPAIHSTPADVTLHPGHTYHLWADDGERAILIGVVSPSISHSLAVASPDRIRVRPGSRLLVTLDPDDADHDFHRARVVAKGTLDSI